MLKRILPVLLLLAAVVAAPLWLRRDTKVVDAGSAEDRLVILTPHNDSIRKEFGEAFAEHWRARTGRSIHVDWRAPGGGGEIRRLIDGAFEAAEALGKRGTEFDLFFGGGTKDFITQAKSGRLAELEVFDLGGLRLAKALVEGGLYVVGDPDDVAGQIRDFWEGVGGFGTFLMLGHDWARPDRTRPPGRHPRGLCQLGEGNAGGVVSSAQAVERGTGRTAGEPG